ncbi:MAG: S24 family peptidase [Bacteroidales bacterium]|nr:S24 family peptidase [Bacteroidales bacterium]
MPIEDFYAIQEFDNADFLIRIKGDSMSPKYNGGDVIACKLVKEVTFWQWHRVYAIYTRNQGVLIKRVEEYPQNRSFITLVSENPAYKPFELHEDEIVSVALVLGAIVLE